MKTAIIVLQSVCIGVTLAGIYMEWVYEAHIGFLLITLGSFIFAISTKLSKITLRQRIKELLNDQKHD